MVTDTAAPVATTIAVAAASPHLMRFTFPALASWSWKNGEDTVNHEGQKPAKTPEASPINKIMIVMSSIVGFAIIVLVYPVVRLYSVRRSDGDVFVADPAPDSISRLIP